MSEGANDLLVSMFKGAALLSVAAVVLAGVVALVALIVLAVLERRERPASARMRYGHAMTLGESVYGWGAARSDRTSWVAEMVSAPAWIFRTICVPLAAAAYAMLIFFLAMVILEKYRSDVASPGRAWIASWTQEGTKNAAKEPTEEVKAEEAKNAAAENAAAEKKGTGFMARFFARNEEKKEQSKQSGGGFLDVVPLIIGIVAVGAVASTVPTLEYLVRRRVTRRTEACRSRALALVQTMFGEVQRMEGLVVLGRGVHGPDGLFARVLESPQLMNDAVAEHPGNASLAFVLGVAHWYRSALGKSHPGFSRLKDCLMTPNVSALGLDPLVDLIADPRSPPLMRIPVEISRALRREARGALGDLENEWNRLVSDLAMEALATHRTAKVYLGTVVGVGASVAAAAALFFSRLMARS